MALGTYDRLAVHDSPPGIVVVARTDGAGYVRSIG